MGAVQPIPDLLVALFLVAGATASLFLKKLTPMAALTGAVLGAVIYAGAGIMGVTLLVVFFLIGTAATSWRKKDKLLIEGPASHQPMRHTGQVLANAGVAALLSSLAIAIPAHNRLFSLMMAAAISSAMADTLSSELGMVYGRRCFHILTLRADRRGADGVVSIEGLVLGIAGSILIAAIYGIFTIPQHSPFFPLAMVLPWRSFFLIVAAGTFGNLADSVLGALFERRGLLSNDLVNFLNTLLAAGFAGALAL